MTNMFIPKKERIIIIVEAVIYILLVILASYFTICGNIFIRMVPMIYFLGIFGVILFNKPIVTVLFTFISTLVFGFFSEREINSAVLFSIYSVFMIICGEATGYILNLLYQNFKLRKFIKYYHKIVYIIILIACILIPLFLNNVVNSNCISYIRVKNSIDKYVTENYVYSNYYTRQVSYIPSYQGGMYQFDTVIDGVNVKLTCSLDGNISDINMENRKDALTRVANAEINILLREKELTDLDIQCRYDYSKIASIPDIIKINILNVELSQVNRVVSFLKYIKEWEKYELVERIDIVVNDINVSITKNDLEEKNITEEYILNGMNYEMLDYKEGK